MDKIDFKKKLKPLYQPSAKAVVQVDVPPANFLMVDGEGDPNTSRAYKEAIEVLYAVAYAVKFMVKKGSLAIAYGVMPLEGLWWADDMASFTTGDKSKWHWTMREPGSGSQGSQGQVFLVACSKARGITRNKKGLTP